MNPQHLNCSARTRRLLYFAALSTLLAALLFSAGCKQEGTTNKTPATPAPSPNETPSLRLPSDDPVVITGGSTDLDFEQRVIRRVPGQDLFSNDPDEANLKVNSLRIYNDESDTDFIDYVIPPSGKCSITLKATQGPVTSPTVTEPIVVEDNAMDGADGKVNVKFKVNAFRPRRQSVSRRKRYNRMLKIQRIEDVVVTVGGSPITSCTNQAGQAVTCALFNKFTIEIGIKEFAR